MTTATLAALRPVGGDNGRTWHVDPARSTLEFRVDRLWSLVTVQGRFERFQGDVGLTADGRWQFQLAIESGSVNTYARCRDAYLRSPMFLDAARHPVVRFTSTDVVNLGKGRLRVRGRLETARRCILVDFDAEVRADDGEIAVEATLAADQQAAETGSSTVAARRAAPSLIASLRLSERVAVNTPATASRFA